jgi:hypothetical protein
MRSARTVMAQHPVKHLARGLLGALTLAAVACGGSAKAPSTADAPPATTPAQPTPQATAQAGQPPHGLQPLTLAQGAGQNTTPVDFEKLIALLPDAPAGWVRGKSKGNLVDTGVAISAAEADYEKGEASIHLELTDTAFNQVYLAPLHFTLVAHYSERSPTGYTKAEPIGGSPGFEKWDGDAKSAEVTAVVGNRIVITAKGHDVDNADATRGLVAAVDQGRLKALK